jgi:hypothetical protein
VLIQRRPDVMFRSKTKRPLAAKRGEIDTWFVWTAMAYVYAANRMHRSDWLMRLTQNQMGFSRTGSNPVDDVFLDLNFSIRWQSSALATASMLMEVHLVRFALFFLML